MEHESVIINVLLGWPILNVLFVWPTFSCAMGQWGWGGWGRGGARQQVMNCRSARREVGLTAVCVFAPPDDREGAEDGGEQASQEERKRGRGRARHGRPGLVEQVLRLRGDHDQGTSLPVSSRDPCVTSCLLA